MTHQPLLTDDGHHTILKLVDKCFGVYFIGLSILMAHAAFLGHLSWLGFSIQLSFPIVNLILSQVSLRIKTPRLFEGFRLILNSFFIVFGYLLIDGAFEPFWISLIILSIGAPMILMTIDFSPKYAPISILINIVALAVIVAFHEETPNWYQFISYAGASLMLGVFVSQAMDLLTRTVKREFAQKTELQKSRALIVDQQQALIASSKMSALGEMAGGIAHEINNPLAIIKSLSGQIQEVLGDDNLDRETLRDMSTQIEKTSDRIAKIIMGLKTFSRDGSRDPFQKVDIKKWIDETIAFSSERFKNKNIQLLVEDVPAQSFLEGRSTELSQVLLNLLNNSCDAIANSSEKWIRISIKETPDSLEVRVSDSGKGISEELQKKIFQPFFTTKDVGKGTGLGLSISAGIIRSHNGELKVDTQSPNTCFVISLPKTQKKVATTAA